MIRRPPRSTQSRSSAASDVYKRQKVDDAQAVHIAVRAQTVADVHTALMAAAAEYVLPIHHLLDIRRRVQLAGAELKLLLKTL